MYRWALLIAIHYAILQKTYSSIIYPVTWKVDPPYSHHTVHKIDWFLKCLVRFSKLYRYGSSLDTITGETLHVSICILTCACVCSHLCVVVTVDDSYFIMDIYKSGKGSFPGACSLHIHILSNFSKTCGGIINIAT